MLCVDRLIIVRCTYPLCSAQPHQIQPVIAYDASHQASVRALDKSLMKNGVIRNWFPDLISLQVRQYRDPQRL
jgi:hypothetical protein